MIVSAKKSLGQNFLVNPHILDKIITASEINSNSIVVEIGPGTGNLTRKLADKAGTVIAVEKDRRLIEPLRELFKNKAGVKIVEEDILKFKPSTYNLLPSSYKIIGNIPYYLTSNLLRTRLEDWPKPESIILTVQKEVAQRMVAKPPHMNLLALSVQYYSEPSVAGYISKNNFRPVPKVDSAIIKLLPKSATSDPKLFNLMKIGFSEKRKQLVPVLSKKIKVPKAKILEVLEKEGIEPNVRAENLSLDEWQKLSLMLYT